MIGTNVKRKADGEVFTITAFHGGEYILSPVEFGSPIAVPYAVLADEFRVKASDVVPPLSEADALRERDAETNATINQTYGRAAAGRAKPAAPYEPPEGSPEAVFRELDR